MVCREIPVRPEERNIYVRALVARHLGDELAGDGAERHAEMTMPECVKDIVRPRRAADHGQGVRRRRSGPNPAARDFQFEIADQPRVSLEYPHGAFMVWRRIDRSE